MSKDKFTANQPAAATAGTRAFPVLSLNVFNRCETKHIFVLGGKKEDKSKVTEAKEEEEEDEPAGKQ